MKFGRDVILIFNAGGSMKKVIVLPVTIIEGKAEGRTMKKVIVLPVTIIEGKAEGRTIGN
jgi:ribosomal protein S28E/S33